MSRLPYQYLPERGAYFCQATHRQIFRQSHHDPVPLLTEADTTYNWAVRRGDLLLVSGDFPRYAFLTRRREPRADPSPLKFGDVRLRLQTDHGVFRWENASSIPTTFHPTHVEHVVRWAKLPGVVGHMRVGLRGGSGAVALVSIKAETGASFSGWLVLDYGGVSTHGRTFTAAYLPPEAPDDPRSTVTLAKDGGVLSCPDYPERLAFRLDGHPKLESAKGRLTAKWPVDLTAGGSFAVGSTWELLSVPTQQPAPPSPSDVAAAFKDIEADERAFLAKTVATTPDGDIGPGFDAAILTLENAWDRSGWLEGVHWWSCYWANNYQISAAIALGQWDRARRTLEFFLDDEGNCPARAADGSGMCPHGNFEALPFWLHQFASYVDATGDRALVLKLRPYVEKSIGFLLADKQTAPSGLLNYHKGSNSTIYQADHLGWPGEATSISFIVACGLREWGQLCREAGDAEAGASWIQKADHIERQARARLWDEERGCFYSHRDDADQTFRSHYYSDHVYPVLYGNILSAPEAASVLEVLRREMVYETSDQRLLMRVGTYKPSAFATDNVMPTQTAEAAMAFARLGQNEIAARLLQAVALGGAIDTESPGSFPERLNDFGKGESNYGFGNPAGAYPMAVVNGLFGVILRQGGAACQWTPGFPNDWPSAQLHLPWVDLGYARSSKPEGKETRKYDYASAQARQLEFRVLLPAADAYHVVADQGKAEFRLSPGIGGTWLTLASYSTQKTSIEISFTPRKIDIPGPSIVAVGEPATWQMPPGMVALDDPAEVLSDVRFDERKLTGTPRPPVRGFESRNTIYATLRSPSTIVPIAFTTVFPVTLVRADLVVEGAEPAVATAKLKLKLRPAPESIRPANLVVDLVGNHAVVPWHGEENVSIDVPVPRSGGIPAAIPLQLRVKMEAQDGSNLMDRELIVIPHGADSAAESMLRQGRARQANPVDLSGLPQSGRFYLTIPWRGSPPLEPEKHPDLRLRTHAEKGFESDGEVFSVRADKDSYCVVDGGISAPSRKPVPLAVLKSLVIPVNRRVCGISMLFASELEARVNEACVGEIRFTYARGPDKVVPLVANANIDALRQHHAPECSPVRLTEEEGGGDILNVLRLPCDEAQTLDRITITIQQRDARLGLIGLHTFAAQE